MQLTKQSIKSRNRNKDNVPRHKPTAPLNGTWHSYTILLIGVSTSNTNWERLPLALQKLIHENHACIYFIIPPALERKKERKNKTDFVQIMKFSLCLLDN